MNRFNKLCAINFLQNLMSLQKKDDALRLASMVKNSSYIDLETNARSHGGEVAVITRSFLKALPNI